MTRSVETHTIAWRGITIEIEYEADWLGAARLERACHFGIRSVMPHKAPLPFTETGYRSHFANPEDIDADGGPVAFVTAWLDHAAQSKEWKESQEEARQLALF